MKLIINDRLTYSETYCPDISSSEQDYNSEEFELVHDLLKEFGIFHNYMIMESGRELAVQEQKVVLTEENMNTFFYEVLDRLFNYKLSYTGLGGKGYDFCITVENADG